MEPLIPARLMMRRQLYPSVVEGILEGARIQAGEQVQDTRYSTCPYGPSLTVGSPCILMKGRPVKHCPLLGPERTGHPHRDEPMGGRQDFLPSISEQRVFGDRLWLIAGKRHRAAECSQAVTWHIRVTNMRLSL